MGDGWGIADYGLSPWGGIVGASGSFIRGRFRCWPIEPGSVTIIAGDGISYKQVTDDEEGNLIGDGHGIIRYDYGHFQVAFASSVGHPLPSPGDKVYASYRPVEGGCYEACSRCLTNKLRLDVSPGSIAGQDSISVADAWARLFDKIRNDVLPIHVELVSDYALESCLVNIGNRFDLIASDEKYLDNGDGLKTEFDAT